MKRLVVFDLDGTLAESKTSIDDEMVGLLNSLLTVLKVAVISGGDWPQFESQLLSPFLKVEGLSNLVLLPTCGTKFYRYTSQWQKIYSYDLSNVEKQRIFTALEDVTESLHLVAEKTWGEIIEDRDSQITYSALGQQAPLQEKEVWDPDFQKRKKMLGLLEPLLPEFSIRIGGTTSVDVTRAGVDKAYGIEQIVEILHISKEEMIFVGDAIFPGGNDYPVKEAGVESIQVRDPGETKRVIEAIVAASR